MEHEQDGSTPEVPDQAVQRRRLARLRRSSSRTIVGMTRFASRSADSEITATPSRNLLARCSAAASASLVFPTPPGPVNVTSRVSLASIDSMTIRRSASRPIKGDDAAGDWRPWLRGGISRCRYARWSALSWSAVASA